MFAKFLCLALFCAGSFSVRAAMEVVPADFSGAKQPQVSVSSNGRIYVAFGKDDSIYCVHSSDGGGHFEAPVLIAHVDKLALGMRRGPRIFANDKTIVVSAISGKDGNLYSWRTADSGKSWS